MENQPGGERAELETELAAEQAKLDKGQKNLADAQAQVEKLLAVKKAAQNPPGQPLGDRVASSVGKVKERVGKRITAGKGTLRSAVNIGKEMLNSAGEGHAKAGNPERKTKLENNLPTIEPEKPKETNSGAAPDKRKTSKIKKGIKAFDAAVSAIRTPSDISLERPETSSDIKKELGSVVGKEEREKVGWGINNLGFKLERAKNDWFAKVFGSLQSNQENPKGKVSRFLKGLENSFKKDADTAYKKEKAAKEPGSKLTKISNWAYMAKNIIRPARLVMDATGLAPRRLALILAMVGSRVTGAAKEARFANEELIEQTRIEDAEKAAEEAWKIYENAQTKTGKVGVSVDDLKTAYLNEIPKDLQKRLEDTTVANESTKSLMRRHLKWDIDRLNKDLDGVDADQKLSSAKKEAKKEQIIRRWERRLVDYDRMLTTTGTVDAWARAGLLAESTAKNIVRGLTLESLYVQVDKLYEMWAHMGGSSEATEVVQSIKKSADSLATKTETPAVAPGSNQNNIFIDSIAKKNAELLKARDSILADSTKTPGGTITPLKTFVVTPEDTNIAHADSSVVDSLKANTDSILDQTTTTTTGAQEAIAKATEKVSNAISTEFKIKLGEGDVPKNLETVFSAIAANSMSAPTGGVDEEFATKSLNVAANLVKLTEGAPSVAGVTQAEWATAGNFYNGELEIKDHKAFNEILARLQAKATENWDNGTLRGQGAAISQIPNISKDGWLKILHADGLEKSGIAGHDGLKEVADFDKSEMVAKARTAVLEKMGGGEVAPDPVEALPPTDMRAKIFVTPSEQPNLPTGAKLDPLKDVLVAKVTQPTEDALIFGEIGEGGPNVRTEPEFDPTRDTRSDGFNYNYGPTRTNPYGGFSERLLGRTVTQEMMAYADNVAIKNLETIFPENTKEVWDSLSGMQVSKIFEMTEAEAKEQKLTRLISYLKRLQQVTGLEPKGKSLLNWTGESTEDYVRRAMRFATENKLLEAVKIKSK